MVRKVKVEVKATKQKRYDGQPHPVNCEKCMENMEVNTKYILRYGTCLMITGIYVNGCSYEIYGKQKNQRKFPFIPKREIKIDEGFAEWEHQVYIHAVQPVKEMTCSLYMRIAKPPSYELSYLETYPGNNGYITVYGSEELETIAVTKSCGYFSKHVAYNPNKRILEYRIYGYSWKWPDKYRGLEKYFEPSTVVLDNDQNREVLQYFKQFLDSLPVEENCIHNLPPGASFDEYVLCTDKNENVFGYTYPVFKGFSQVASESHNFEFEIFFGKISKYCHFRNLKLLNYRVRIR